MIKKKKKQRYNILVVMRWPVGGIRTFIRYVYRSFDSHRYSFTILAPDLPELRFLLNDLSVLDLSYIPIKQKPSNKNFFLAVSKAIYNGNFDLIHSHGFTSGICSILASVLTVTPHILTSHDVFTEGQFTGVKGLLKKKALSAALPMIDVIHSVSHDAQDNLLAYLVILKGFRNKLVTIPNGIEVKRFLKAQKRDIRKELGLAKDTFLIGFLGRFMAQKGFKYLVEALEIMIRRQNLPKKPLILTFGEGGFIREEKQIINDKGFKDYIIFMPFEPNIAPVLKGLDVMAIPSLWEACPLQPMEAMIAGVPVIGTDCIGLREVLKDTASVVVPKKNCEALAQALANEMRAPSTTKAKAFMAEAAIRFDVKGQARELEKVMLKLLDA